jgi:ketosteroid isomerase-like protein
MKMHLLPTLAGLAIGFAVPAVAQEQNTVDQEVRQQIEAAVLKYQEAYNKYDATACAAGFTQHAIEVLEWSSASATGAASGRQEIEGRYGFELASHPTKQSFKLVQVYPIGSDVCAIWEIFHYSRQEKGYYTAIYVREADDWKIRMAYAN